MANNVQCAGREQITYPFPGVRKTQYTRPCGWEDHRPGLPVAVDGKLDWNVLTISNDPCPRCGGKVQLIRPTQEVER